MWTEGMRAAVPTLVFLLLAGTLGQPTIGVAQEGQYRSKVIITPNDGDWARGAELSIEELEQQLGSIEEAYAKSSAGRHLARHYVERKEYDKAIEFYQQALSAEGLSDVANREMLRELAQVYLLKKDYGAAAQTLQQVLAINLVPDVADFLMLARAQHHLRQYVDVVATLDRMQKARLSLDVAQIQQALALYYHAGAFAQCEVLLSRLLELQPGDAQNWHLLASVYLQQNKRKQALDQLTLARTKLVPFSERDILLLAGLQSANNNSYGAAQTLEGALSSGEVAANAANYRRLFEFWLQAREQEKARKALQQAARLSPEVELSLHLAQLQMEDEEFAEMYQTILAVCAKQLPDKFVGRANLLLGVSQLKLGDAPGARRSFINATLIGGVNAQAGQWLRFMDAAPASDGETRRIVSICYGANDKRLDASTSAVPVSVESAVADKAASVAFEIKTVPPMALYYLQSSAPLSAVLASLRASVMGLYVSLAKSGGSVDGPLQIILLGDLLGPQDALSLQLASPVRGTALGSGKFRVGRAGEFRCASRTFEGAGDGVSAALAELAAAALAAQHELTGETRIVIPQGDNTGGLRLELQMGIR